MIFLHPLALLALAAAAIPALLHLFQRRTPPEADFPPLRYLSEAERRSARRLRLRHLLLLLLRTGLIVVTVLAAARPQIPTRSASAVGHAPAALAVVLDNSPSAGAVSGGQLVLDRLKVAARAVLRRAGGADRVWLFLADGVARSGAREELLRAVDSVTIDPHRLDLNAAVARAARVVDAEPLSVREVHVISDLQRTALGAGRVSVPPHVRVMALAPAGDAVPNRGITAAVLAEGGRGVTVTIGGTPGTPPAPVSLRINGRDVQHALGAPGGVVTLPLPTQQPGWWVGDVTLDPDELRADDRRPLVWHERPPARVSAPPAAGPFVTAALRVLRAGQRVADGTEVTIDERLGTGFSVVLPPADPVLVGEVNRALAARGVGWRFGEAGPPGMLEVGGQSVADIPVSRRLRLQRGPGADSATVLAAVGGEPWAVRSGAVVMLGSRLDTAWTLLPARSAFVPFVDELVNQWARGDVPVAEREGAPRVAFTVAGVDTIGATVFAPDPRESDLTPARSGVVHDALGADVLDDADFAVAAFAGTRRADAGTALLILALLLAAAELLVATLAR